MERIDQKKFPRETYSQLAKNIRDIANGDLRPEDIGISDKIMERMLEKTAARAKQENDMQILAEEAKVARQNSNITNFKTKITLLTNQYTKFDEIY